jgi:hypothetical protein
MDSWNYRKGSEGSQFATVYLKLTLGPEANSLWGLLELNLR